MFLPWSWFSVKHLLQDRGQQNVWTDSQQVENIFQFQRRTLSKVMQNKRHAQPLFSLLVTSMLLLANESNTGKSF